MDWEAKERERQQKIKERREYLLKMPEVEAMQLPAHEWYEWMRYHREVEAALWLDSIRRQLPTSPETPVKSKQYYRNQKTRVDFHHD